MPELKTGGHKQLVAVAVAYDSSRSRPLCDYLASFVTFCT